MARKKADEVAGEAAQETAVEKPKKKSTRGKKLDPTQELLVQMKVEEGMSKEEAVEEVLEQTGDVDVNLNDVLAMAEEVEEYEEILEEVSDEENEESASDEETDNSEEPQTETKRRGRPPKKRAVIKANRKQSRRIYRNEYFIEALNPNEHVTTDKEVRKQEYLKLAQAATNTLNGRPTILTGIINGYKTTPAGNILVTIDYKGPLGGVEETLKYFTIEAPVELMFPVDDLENYAKNTLHLESVGNMVRSRIGAPVHFFLQRVIEAAGKAYASRVHAMSFEAHGNYGVVVKETGQPRVISGTVANATVTGVNSAGVWVEVGGAETYITREELSWSRIGNCTETYEVGQKLPVMIKKVTPKKMSKQSRGELIGLKYYDIVASVKATKKSPEEIYYHKYTLGQVLQGTVTQVNENGYFVALNPDYNIFCAAPQNGKTAIVDQKVIIKITKKYDDTKKIFGEIYSIQKIK